VSPISSATIFQKNQILDWYHTNGKNQTKTAKHFQTVYPELRIKQPLISAWLKNEGSIRAKKKYVNASVKRMRMIQYPRVDELLGEWAREAIAHHVHLTDSLLREKWKELARQENIPPDDWLHLSHGWLASFKARKGLKQQRRSSLSSSTAAAADDDAATGIPSSIPVPSSHSALSAHTHPHHMSAQESLLISVPQHRGVEPTPGSTSDVSPFSGGHLAARPPGHSTAVSRSPATPALVLPSNGSGEPTTSSGGLTSVPAQRLSGSSRPPASVEAHRGSLSCVHLARTHHSPLLLPRAASSSSSSSTSSPAAAAAPPTINQALHSVHLLLAYLPATTTTTSDETSSTLALIDSLAAYREYLVEKIRKSSGPF
jgi:hypothetical protein